MKLATLPLIGRLFGKRSTWRNPAGWLIDWATGGGTTAAGVSVNEDSALKSSVVFACVAAISSDVAKLPLCIYRRSGDERTKLDSHPAYWLLHRSPNPLMTAFDFRSVLTAHALTWGNGYALIVRDGANRITELWPLRPDRMTPYRTGERTIVYVYRYQPSDGSGIREIGYMQDEILHIPGLGFDGLVGYDVITYARESIGAAIGAQKFGASFFGNGARPGGTLEHPGQLSDDAAKRLRESWNTMHQGPANQHKLAILEEGMKYNPFTVSPENAQFIETRQFDVSEVCRWFRMPPRKVGDTSRAQGWSTLESSNTEYVQDTLMPWLLRWEQRINMRILANATGDVYAEHIIEGLLRGDSSARSTFYQSAITNGWMTRNEVRRLENLEPLDGLDEPLTPVNVAQKEEAKPESEYEQPEDDPEPEEETDDERMAGIDSTFSALFVEAAGRIVRREANAIKRAVRKLDSFPRWVDTFFAEERATFRAMIGPSVDGYAEAVWTLRGDGTVPDTLRERAGSFASDMAERHCESCRSELAELMAETEKSHWEEEIGKRMAEWTAEIPASIAAVEMANERTALQFNHERAIHANT